MSKSQAVAWAEDIAKQAASQDGARRDVADRHVEAAAAFQALVAREGKVWMQRLAAALEAAASSVNQRLGRPLIVTHRSPTGSMSISVHPAFVSVISVFDPSDTPELAVTTQYPDGRRGLDRHAFSHEGERIVALIAGVDHGPESAARSIAEEWLKQVLRHYSER